MAKQAIFCFLILLPFATNAQQFGESVRISSPVDHDLYAAGRTVDLLSPVKGDAVVAGQTILIAAPVLQDVIAAGELVELSAKVGDDVRAAGRRVHIGSEVTDHLIAAGDSVTIARDARVGSFAWIAGREVVIEGEIRGPLKAVADSVRIAGHVAGDAEIQAEKIELLPGARLDGNLKWTGKEPRVADNARVGGQLLGEPTPERKRREVRATALYMEILLIAAFAVAGLVLYLLFPYAAERAAHEIRARPGIDAALGFAVLVVTPFAAVLLFVTGVGWLLGLVLLILYIAALFTGGLIGAYALTDMALYASNKHESGRALRALVLIGVIVLVGVLQWVPVIGWLAALLLLLWGLGATAKLTFRPAPISGTTS